METNQITESKYGQQIAQARMQVLALENDLQAAKERLADIWHLPNDGIFRNAILSNAIELEPQFLTPIEEGMLLDLGLPVKTTAAVSLDDLFPRRADPWRNQQPVIITAPTGEIIPHNP